MKITDGHLMLYWCFDIADEINISLIERQPGWQAEKAFLSGIRVAPEYIQYSTPPLLLKLGNQKLPRGLDAIVEMKVYEFGVVTIRFTSAIECELEQLIQLSRFVQESSEIRALAIEWLKKTIDRIIPAAIRPVKSPESDWEDYAIFWIHSFDRRMDAELLLKEQGDCISKILRAEEKQSIQEKEDALKYPLSYFGEDLTLIDWGSAFIYDPWKTFDVLDVIEFSVIQLLELRVYDTILDKAIENAYDDLIALRKRKLKIVTISSVLNRFSRIKLDISDVIDRLENFLKLVGDLYLAKVYTAASNRFYLDRWKLAVRNKLNIIESLYTKEWERFQTRRMVVAEIAIVVLFIIDIILILFEIFKAK
ncbi:MAG: hypothetical protein NC907_04410 [Candidatus Omnitrophica bacterium]|nr:hypothetical protein [Candidatus Omnitrophota bacterium]